MTNTIKLKRGSGSDPAASDMVVGEPVLRSDTAELFFKKDDGSVAKVSGGGGGGSSFQYLALRNAANDGAASYPGNDFTLVTSGTTTAVSPATANALILSYGGVVQKPNSGTSTSGITGFIVDGSRLKTATNFAAAPDFIVYQESGGIGEPSDNTVTSAKIADNAVGAEHIEVLDANLQLADSVKIQVGAGNDLEIYHDGNSYVTNTTANQLAVQSNDLKLRSYTDLENYLVATHNGAVELYYNGSKKFETTSAGIQVTGHAWFTDNYKAQFGASNDLQIYHNLTGNLSTIHNSHANGIAVRSNVIMLQNQAGDHDYLTTANELGVTLYYDNGARFATTSDGASVTGTLTATGQITGNSSNSGKYVRMYGSSGTGRWDIYGHGANLRFSDNDSAGSIVFDRNVDANGGLDVTGTCTATSFVGPLTGNVTGNASGSSGSCTGNAATATVATAVTVVDESSDTSCHVLFADSATGNLSVKSGTNLTFNSSSGALTAASFSGNGANLTAVNASTVFGLLASQFLRSDAEDSSSAPLNINGGTANGANDSTLYVTADNNNDWGLTVDKYRSSATEYGARIKVGSSASMGLIVYGNNSEVFRVRGNGLVTAGGTNTVFHAGNDGPGSGIDADTCDGQHLGTSASPTFAEVYTNGWLRNNDSGDGLYNTANNAHFYSPGSKYWHLNPSASQGNGGLILYSGYNGTHGNATGRQGYLYWDTNGFGLLHSGGNWIIRGNTTNTAIYGTLTHGGSNTIWHAGNDGSGSGLDADTLDGVQANKFLTSYNNAGTTGWEDSNANFRINGGATGSVGLAMHTSNGTFGYQLYASGGSTYGFLNGNWAGWDMKKVISGNLTLNNNDANIVWHAGNDGPGSGLDADTLDTIASTSFLRSDSDDTFSGSLTSNARNNGIFGTYDSTKTDHIWSMGTGYKNHSSGTNFGSLYGLAYKHTNNSTGGTMGGGHMMVWCTNGSPRGSIGHSNIWTVGDFRATSSNHIVMHAGNDGPASGFDADTLDNLHATSFVRNSHNNNYLINFGSGTDTGHTRTSHAYAIFQEGGGWSGTYPDLCINYHTGIKIGCGHQSYGGLRFTPDYNSTTILMSINNGTETNGNGNVKINTKLYINNQIDSSSIIRTDHTFYNDTSGDGTYSSATGMYWYSDGSNVMNIAGGTAANWIRFRDEDGGTIRGYIGANNSSSVGILGHDGNWAASFSAWSNWSYKSLHPSPDNTNDLGKSDRRWDDVYATNSSIQTSDRNEKTTIVDSDLGLSFVNKLKPISYKWKGKTRTHYGFIAQDIETVITDLGKTTAQFAGLIKADISEAKDGSEYRYGLRYEQLLAPIVKAIQELAVKVAALESA